MSTVTTPVNIFSLWEFVEIMHSVNEERPDYFFISDNISGIFQVQNFQIIK